MMPHSDLLLCLNREGEDLSCVPKEERGPQHRATRIHRVDMAGKKEKISAGHTYIPRKYKVSLFSQKKRRDRGCPQRIPLDRYNVKGERKRKGQGGKEGSCVFPLGLDWGACIGVMPVLNHV